MCFDYDGYADIYNRSRPRARKEHRCCECGGTIAAGEQYHRVESLYDGDWATDRWCDRCEAVRQIIHDHEIADGCGESEAWPPHRGLRDAIVDSDGYGLVEYDGERYRSILEIAPVAGHLIRV